MILDHIKALALGWVEPETPVLHVGFCLDHEYKWKWNRG